MTLGIFLALGESFSGMAKTGQDIQFEKFYLASFAKNFAKVYIFTYADEKVTGLPKNVVIVPNRFRLHRYLYAIVLPFLNLSTIKKCACLRVYHLTGTVPVITTRLLLNKPFVFNWAFDYFNFAKIEGKIFQEFLLYLLKPLAIFASSKIFAANRTIYKSLPQKKTVYLPNGVDTAFFKPQKVKKHKRLQILSVGRLVKQKNFKNLVNALNDIDADLTLVGDGDQKSDLTRLARSKKFKLKIITHVAYDQMPRVYHLADIFILPSLAEGHPKALLEAMACGLAVIGTNVEGTKELIIDKRTGILTESDPSSMATAIEGLIADSNLRDSLGKNARLFVEKNFDLNKLLKKEIETLESL